MGYAPREGRNPSDEGLILIAPAYYDSILEGLHLRLPAMAVDQFEDLIDLVAFGLAVGRRLQIDEVSDTRFPKDTVGSPATDLFES